MRSNHNASSTCPKSLHAGRSGGSGNGLLFVQPQQFAVGGPLALSEIVHFSEEVRDFLAGGLAEGVSRMCLHPLETLKVRKQMSQVLSRAGGVRGIYMGLGESLVGAVPSTGAFVMIYHMLKSRAMNCFPEKLEAPVSVACGVLATTISCLVEEPLEVVKQRLQSGVSTSFGHAVQHVTKQKGPLGLYSGIRSTLAKDLPFDALEFAVYEQLRGLYYKHKRRKHLLEHEVLMFGMATGALVGFVTLPMDVVRTRIVTQPLKYQGVRRTVRLLLKEEGALSLFKGARYRLPKEAIESGLFFVVYENVQRLLSRKEENTDFGK
ncbi:hypothetical protein NDN08_004044 [Rhodosorus marinus]|uniref:Mitochondrial carrier protein n=1 Tax=Rhodosorus marinus TaxID=101924 RepID=A0AAV8UIJ7_9RHOD|nr:hypothetical protein NDN08_004044 [Rhodosorus marinus]